MDKKTFERKMQLQKSRFHRNKILQLEKEWCRRKEAGENKVKKLQETLHNELARLLNQIADHRKKANEASRLAQEN